MFLIQGKKRATPITKYFFIFFVVLLHIDCSGNNDHSAECKLLAAEYKQLKKQHSFLIAEKNCLKVMGKHLVEEGKILKGELDRLDAELRQLRDEANKIYDESGRLMKGRLRPTLEENIRVQTKQNSIHTKKNSLMKKAIYPKLSKEEKNRLETECKQKETKLQVEAKKIVASMVVMKKYFEGESSSIEKNCLKDKNKEIIDSK